MKLSKLAHWARLIRSRWIKAPWGLMSGALMLTGCASDKVWIEPHEATPQAMPGASEPQSLPPIESIKWPQSETVPEQLPEPGALKQPVPVTLDVVLRLAEGQNQQISLARERLHETHINQELADLAWIPQINVGVAYFRHEGGIQDQPGQLVRSSTGALQGGADLNARLDLREQVYLRVNAERQMWQQKGELARITSEKLVEAANAYMDLLLARNLEAVLLSVQEKEKYPLKWAEDRLKVDKQMKILLESIRAQSGAREQMLLQLQQQAETASVKLAHLLGIKPGTPIAPGDSRMIPITLLNAQQPTEAFVAHATSSGPGVRELEGLLGSIHQGIEESTGWKSHMPIIEMRMLEAGFGAGQGSTLDFANRWDLGVQLRWNISELFTSEQKLRQAHSRLQQAQISYKDLQSQLAAAVRASHMTIQHSNKQIKHALKQIEKGLEIFELAKVRLENNVSKDPTEVMGAIEQIQTAQITALKLIYAHNLAQVQLLVLLGPKPLHAKGAHHPK